jgi:hypothetical protein
MTEIDRHRRARWSAHGLDRTHQLRAFRFLKKQKQALWFGFERVFSRETVSTLLETL